MVMRAFRSTVSSSTALALDRDAVFFITTFAIPWAVSIGSSTASSTDPGGTGPCREDGSMGHRGLMAGIVAALPRR